MKIGLYDPYLETLGGGERYILTIASCLKARHDVTLFWDDKDILKKVKERFLLNLSGISVSPNIFTKNTSLPYRFRNTLPFDYFFYISDGSIPIIGARNVFPIVQFPIQDLKVNDIGSRIKLLNTREILCYSSFVKEYLEKTYPISVRILYPPVPKIPETGKKENIILSVGRFTQGNNTKKQEVLINFFKAHKLHFQGWKLILAGSCLPQDRGYVDTLKAMIGKSQIEIYENINFAKLVSLYSQAKMYWHAAGYNEDLKTYPEFAEHFGITTVEAMSAGCVPVVFNGGGQKEIVENGKNGYLWNDLSELFHNTKLVMTDRWKREELSENARKRADDFSIDSFCQSVQSFIK